MDNIDYVRVLQASLQGPFSSEYNEYDHTEEAMIEANTISRSFIERYQGFLS